MSPSKMITCCATGTCYTSIADLRYAVRIYNIHTVILQHLQRFWIINFPLRQLVLQKTFSDGALAEILVMATLQTNDWQRPTLRKFRKSFVDRDILWKGLTLATRRCCDSNAWHQKPLEGHEPDIVLNAIWRLTVHKHPSWFRIDRRNKVLRWFRGVDALVTRTWALTTFANTPGYSKMRQHTTNIQHDECDAGLGVLCAYIFAHSLIILHIFEDIVDISYRHHI